MHGADLAAALGVVAAGLGRALLAVALLLLLALVGYALVPGRLRPRTATLSVPFGLSAGMLATGWLSWIAGTLLGTWAVFAVWVLLLAAAAPKALPFLRDLARVVRHLVALLRASPLLSVALGLCVALLVPGLFLPLLDSDGIRYQVAQPKLALLTGHVETYRWDVTGYFPQLGPMLYLVATALGGGETCKLVHAGFALAAAAVLALFVHRGRRDRTASVAAPLLLLSAPVAASPATAAFLDHAALFHVATALLLVSRSCAPFATGLALGAAFATKMTTAPAILGLGVAVTVAARPGRRLAALGSCAAAAALAFLPFGARSALATGDPFFPLGFGVLSRPIPGVTAAGLRWATSYRDVPPGLLAFGWFPGQPGMAWDDVVGPWALLALLALPTLLVERRLSVLLALAVPSLAAAALWHPPARYFLPLFWALAALLGVALFRAARRVAVPATLALSAAGLAGGAPHLVGDFGGLPHLLGRIPGAEVLSRSIPGYRAARYVATLPRGTVMALDFPGPYYFDRPWVVEGVLNAPPLALWLAEGAGADGLLARLRALGVRHLVVTPGYGGGSRASLLPLATSAATARTVLALRARLRLLATIDGVDVYEVPEPGG